MTYDGSRQYLLSESISGSVTCYLRRGAILSLQNKPEALSRALLHYQTKKTEIRGLIFVNGESPECGYL
jgi:hypothetical protein